jgi:tRNA(Ile)-lysidine synthase
VPQLPRAEFELLHRFRRALPMDVAAAARRLIAVSGGSDSMALLELTALARDPSQGNDLAVYVDHGLRPDAVDEARVAFEAAARLGIRARLARIQPGGHDENSLRERRYRTLEHIAEEERCSWVLTGHTRDDQVETVLHRLVRGAGRHGLGGIPVRRGRLLRPLLGFTRVELRAFLTARRVAWREDSSNEDRRYTRNRLRHDVVPALRRSLGAGCVDHLADMAGIWTTEDDYLEQQADRFAAFALHGSGSASTLDAAAMRITPVALRTRVARRWLTTISDRAPSSFSLAELTRVVDAALAARGRLALRVAGLRIIAERGVLSRDVIPEAWHDGQAAAQECAGDSAQDRWQSRRR